MSSAQWPVTGGGSAYFGDAVANVAALPAAGAVVGEVRLVLDVLDFYEWNGSAWQAITQNTADVTGQSSSVDSEIALFSGTTGKVIKRATGTGFVKVVSGVMQSPSSSVALGSEVSGTLPVANGGTNSTTALNNNRVMQSSGGAIVEAAAITASRALVSDANGIPTHATTTATEIGYVNGVTSSIQTQLDAKLPKSGGTMTGDLVLAGDPDSALKAATKQYVDSIAAGLDVKPSVACATTANITLSGEQTLDGVTTSASRVLVKNQSTASQNGIYLSSSGAWTRVTDMDAWSEVPGAFCFVEQGTLYADTAWVCTADTGGTIGVTSITWSQFAGAGTYTAGTGLTLTGTQFSQTALTASRAVVTDVSGNYTAATTTATEIGYVNGVTSAIQNQLNGKEPTITKLPISQGGTNSTTALNNNRFMVSSAGAVVEASAVTASRALASDSNGLPTASATTATELGYVNGVTSAIQTQLDAKLCATQVIAVSSNVTLTNKAIHFVDTSSARSLTLPSPTASSFIVVKDSTGSAASNNITIVRAASEKIETVAASYVLNSALGSWTFVSNGTDWFII